MLLELKVKNFLLVKELQLNFKEGLNVFTGETGAGKSLLLKSISLLLGAPAKSNWVRNGTQQAEIEGLFEIEKNSPLSRKLFDLGIECDEDENLSIRRNIASSTAGKSRIWIQGKNCTRAELQFLLSDWVEISGQHEFMKLSNEDFLLNVIDRHAELEKNAQEYAVYYEAFKSIDAELGRLLSQKNSEQVLEFKKFQLLDLEKVGIHDTIEDELIQIEDKLKSDTNKQKFSQKFQEIEAHLHGTNDSAWSSNSKQINLGMNQKLNCVLKNIQEFSSIEVKYATLEPMLEKLIDDLASFEQKLSQLKPSTSLNPKEIETLKTKLSNYKRCARKFNCNIAALPSIYINLKKEIQDLSVKDDLVQKLKKELEAALNLLQKNGLAFHKKRMSLSKNFEKEWEKNVQMLGMKEALLNFDWREKEIFNAKGPSRLKVKFASNKKLSANDVNKVASGGELSRIMLALKDITAQKNQIGVYLFDEVDAGIGGETAHVVAQKLKDISAAPGNQVIVITHLPQVASQADRHFQVKKNDQEVGSNIQELKTQARRLEEITRMLGATGSKAAEKLAKEMITQNNS